MNWIDLLYDFLGGGLLANTIPHFVHGVSGRPFQSPFAKPPGKGFSSPAVNVIWGSINAVVAYILLVCVGAFDLFDAAHAASFAAGVIVTGLILAVYFGRLYANDTARPGTDADGSR